MNDRRTGDRALASHEEICAERYAVINSRLGRIEAVLLAVAGTLICAMAFIIFEFIIKK